MKLKFRADKKDFVIFGIFLVVLFFFVAEAVNQINSFATTGELRTLNFFKVMIEQIINDGDFTLVMLTLIFYIVAVGALMGMSSSYFFERESGFGFTTEKKSKNDGYSKLMDEKDMKNDYGIKKIRLKGHTLIINDEEGLEKVFQDSLAKSEYFESCVIEDRTKSDKVNMTSFEMTINLKEPIRK